MTAVPSLARAFARTPRREASSGMTRRHSNRVRPSKGAAFVALAYGVGSLVWILTRPNDDSVLRLILVVFAGFFIAVGAWWLLADLRADDGRG